MPTGTIIAKASGKKAPDKPEIPLFEDTPYITQNRILQNQGYRQSRKALKNVDVMDSDTRNSLQNVADQYTQNQWSDLNRNYTNTMNKMNQANYQRFGSTGSTPALYNTETTQRYYNDLAGEVASNTATKYNELLNNEYNRRLANLQAAYGVFTTSGDKAYKHDYNNYLTQVRNTGINYENEVNDYNKDTAWLRAINKMENIAGGGAMSSWLGPVGGFAAAGIESIDEALLPVAYADTRAYGYESSPMSDFGMIDNPEEYAQFAQMVNQLGASYPTPSGWGSNMMSGKQGNSNSATTSQGMDFITGKTNTMPNFRGQSSGFKPSFSGWTGL